MRVSIRTGTRSQEVPCLHQADALLIGEAFPFGDLLPRPPVGVVPQEEIGGLGHGSILAANRPKDSAKMAAKSMSTIRAMVKATPETDARLYGLLVCVQYTLWPGDQKGPPSPLGALETVMGWIESPSFRGLFEGAVVALQGVREVQGVLGSLDRGCQEIRHAMAEEDEEAAFHALYMLATGLISGVGGLDGFPISSRNAWRIVQPLASLAQANGWHRVRGALESAEEERTGK